jgi:hypothetical protein
LCLAGRKTLIRRSNPAIGQPSNSGTPPVDADFLISRFALANSRSAPISQAEARFPAPLAVAGRDDAETIDPGNDTIEPLMGQSLHQFSLSNGI